MISFKSKQFDIPSEPRNDINPIFGYSLGEYLRNALASDGLNTNDSVESEDWGWYFYVQSNDNTYMIGTTAYVDIDPVTEEPRFTEGPTEFLVQFEKTRSLKQKLFGKNKIKDDEPIIRKVEMILKSNIRDIEDYDRELSN